MHHATKLCRNETVEKANGAADWSGEKTRLCVGVCACVCLHKRACARTAAPAACWKPSASIRWQSEHMVITEGSVTSLSCLVTISAHEESHQNPEHVEAPAARRALSCKNAFLQRVTDTPPHETDEGCSSGQYVINHIRSECITGRGGRFGCGAGGHCRSGLGPPMCQSPSLPNNSHECVIRFAKHNKRKQKTPDASQVKYRAERSLYKFHA